MRLSAGRPSIAVWVLCVCLAGLGNQAAFGQAKLEVTEPKDGAVFAPGSTVHVRVAASGAAFLGVELNTEVPHPDPDPVVLPPYHFTLHIPPKITPGKYTLTASGVTSPGHGVDSRPIQIDVERPDAPVRLTTSPEHLDLNAGDKTVLNITGHYRDGSTAEINASSKTTIASGAPNIVTVDSTGLVTGIRPGSTNIVVNGSLNVSVTVQPYVRIFPETTMTASESTQFSAYVTVPPNTPMAFSISPPGLGKITADGHYTAPSSVSGPRTVRITATNSANRTQFATTTVMLSPRAWVRITPGYAVVYAGQTIPFEAETSNVGQAGVRWSLEPPSPAKLNGNGSISAPRSVEGLTKLALTAVAVEAPGGVANHHCLAFGATVSTVVAEARNQGGRGRCGRRVCGRACH